MLLTLAAGAFRPVMWLVMEWRHCPGGICTVSGTPPEWDFTLFWVAGRLALLRDFTDIFAFANFHNYILRNFHYDPGLSPFAYPPPALLLFTPLALLPLPFAYALWVAAGTVALVAALRIAGLAWAGCFFVLLSPPFLYNLLLGQNGAFTAALLISALTLAGRGPVRAGGFAALLFIKPQMALLLPAAWAGGRRGRALIAAALAGAALVAASILAFGLAPWRMYFSTALPEMRSVMNTALPQASQPNSITGFLLLRAIGMPIEIADWFELAMLVIACIAVYIAFRREGAGLQSMAILFFCSLIVMPYGHNYDMIAYAAVLAMAIQRLGPSMAVAFLWFWPSISRDVVISFGAPLTPFVMLFAIVWARRALGHYA